MTMDFIYKLEGKEERVSPEKWVWRVSYYDNTELKQFGDDGVFHRIGEIDQENIKRAELYKFDDPTKKVVLAWQKDMKIVHFYRNYVFYAGTPMEKKIRVYVFGFKSEGSHSIMYVLPDDSIVMAPDQDAPISLFLDV